MLESENSIVVIIDIQEKLVKAALDGNMIMENAIKVAKAAELLSVPVIITEQYPKGLGATVETLKNSCTNAKIVEKTSFSAYKEVEFCEQIKNVGRKKIILCGIEGHICVLQTALDMIQEGYDVYILKDCTSSREEKNLYTGFEMLQQYGAKLTTTEIVLFQWLKTSKHPHFKDVQKLII